MRYIVNANIVLENGILWDGTLVIKDGMIADFGKGSDIPVPADADVIDAKGLYVGPGFVDIHVHAGGDHLTYVEPLEAAAYYLDRGTTTLMASPSDTLPSANNFT